MKRDHAQDCVPEPDNRVVLDAGALIALDRRGSSRRRMAVALDRIRLGELHAFIPAGVVGQVWRDGAKQAQLAKLVRMRPGVDIVPLDLSHAKVVGEMLRDCTCRDVTDAHVVLVARTRRAHVISSDPDDLHAIDPSVEVQAV